MSDVNPYQPPAATVDDPVTIGSGGELVDPQRVAGSRGWGWFVEGFNLFKRSPGIWIANVVIVFAITMALSFVPLVSLANYVLGPLFAGGLMLGARSLDRGAGLEVAHVFAGFKERPWGLLGIGGLYLLGMIMIGVIVGVFFAAYFMASATAGTGPSEPTPMIILFFMLIGMALGIPLAMAYWFTPALVVLHDINVFKAIGMSFMGCLRNIWPFLLYGLIGLGLMILAIIPVGLGLFVLGPVVTASIYASYKEIFLAQEPAA